MLQEEEPRKIVEDLARDISRGIELICHCGFPSDYIADGKLTCNNQRLVYQGRIISTNDRDSIDYLGDLQKWISTEPTLVVKGEQLHLVKNDSKFTERAPTTEPAQTSANSFQVMTAVAPVGVVVVLVLTLSVSIVTIIVYRRRR